MGAHGLHGEVKVKLTSDFAAERLRRGARVHLKEPQRRFPKEHGVVGGRPFGGQGKQLWLLGLEGVHSREKAAMLQSHLLFVWRADRKQSLDG